MTDFRVLVLIAFRIGGLTLVAPFFSNATIPRKVKIGMIFVLAAVVFPTVDRSGMIVPDNIAGYLAAVLAETAIGALIGLIAALVFAAIQLGGFIAARQVGLAIAHVFDPMTRQRTSVVSQVYFYIGLTIFLMMNGHHMLLQVLASSFQVVPLAGFKPNPEMASAIGMDMMGEVFVSAIRLSAPAVIALMMTTVVMAIIARTVPEMNIFNIGFAVRLGVGLGVLTIGLPAVGAAMQGMFSRMEGNLRTLLEAL